MSSAAHTIGKFLQALGLVLLPVALAYGLTQEGEGVIAKELLLMALGSVAEVSVILLTLPDAFVGGILALILTGETATTMGTQFLQRA